MKVSEKVKALRKERDNLKGDVDFLESDASDAKITDYDIPPKQEHLTRAWRLGLVSPNSGHVKALELIEILLDEIETTFNECG